MKKTYFKPKVYLETFMVNQFAALNCNLSITVDKLDAMNCVNPNHRTHTHTTASRVNNVFTDKSTNCVTLINTGSPFTSSKDGYHPIDGATVYGFTLNGNAREKKYTFHKKTTGYLLNQKTTYWITDEDGETVDDCFGSFINKTSSDTTITPLS